MLHDKQQQAIFFQYVQNGLNDKFLRHEIKRLKQGLDYKVKRTMEQLPEPAKNKQDLYELLWAFCKLNGIKRSAINNVINEYKPTFKEVADAQEIEEELDNTLKTLGIPTFKDYKTDE